MKEQFFFFFSLWLFFKCNTTCSILFYVRFICKKKKKRTEKVISNEYNKTNLSIAPCTHDKLFYGSVSNATIVIHFFIITIIVWGVSNNVKNIPTPYLTLSRFRFELCSACVCPLIDFCHHALHSSRSTDDRLPSSNVLSNQTRVYTRAPSRFRTL